jgi:hypothetical protein
MRAATPLGDAVHVDREADAAIADEGEPKLLFAHGFGLTKTREQVESALFRES